MNAFSHVGLGRIAVLLCGVIVLSAVWSGCDTHVRSSPDFDPADPTAGGGTGNAELLHVEYGRLVDVYGLRPADADGGAATLTLFRADVLVAPEIADQRPPGSSIGDAEIDYDFLDPDPTTFTPRVFIPRMIGSEAFDTLFERLDEGVPRIGAARFGQDTVVRPFPVVPRNAALRLVFSESLGVGADFFRSEAADGSLTRNVGAVQLLRIAGDPGDENDQGDFEPLPIRVVPRGRELTIDTVFLGEEGLRFGVRNNPSGLPESSDRVGANIRLAIALEGPDAIADVHAPAASSFVGKNLDGYRSVFRDFRSGNLGDDSSRLTRGFLRDAERPRLVSRIPMLVAAVEDFDSGTQQVTVFKDGVVHEIDRGDRLVLAPRDPAEGPAAVETAVVDDPVDDRGLPEEQFVRVLVRREDGAAVFDPRGLPSYPTDITSAEGQDWLRRNAPRAFLGASFTAERRDPGSGRVYGDEPVNFLRFTPAPTAQLEGIDPFPGRRSPPNVHVSPFAGVVVEFTKPVDLATVSAFDTFFFATRDLLAPDALDRFALERGASDALTRAKLFTPHLVDARVFDETGSATVIRLQPTMGFYLDDELRREVPPGLGESASDADRASTQRPYFVQILAGFGGIRDLAGNPLELQGEFGGVESLTLPFYLDGRVVTSPSGVRTPLFDENRVVSVVRRFAGPDEDEQPSIYRVGEPGESPFAIPDWFGDVAIADGRLVGRRPARFSRFVDDVNQLQAPPQDSVFRWCPEMHVDPIFGIEGTRPTISAGAPFPTGIQNPLNPFGARLQTVWREVDLSLSRLDPAEFNLDVEQIYWAPVRSADVEFDIFDRVSLYLGHSEYRPEPCVGQTSALAVFSESGLRTENMDLNFAHDQRLTGGGTEPDPERFPDPHPAYEEVQFVIDPADATFGPDAGYLYFPLPEFQEPFFVWRDETVMVQGGQTMRGADNGAIQLPEPYLVSPFFAGQCAPTTIDADGRIQPTQGLWDNRENYQLPNALTPEPFTGGLLGSIALPLLADFRTFCDSDELPAGNGFRADGLNGWQVSLSVTSGPRPNFRVFSGGSPPNDCVEPADPEWNLAVGQANANPNRPGDNSLYWTRVDFLKRQTVATAGFVDIDDPHRMPRRADNFDYDPRLGPYFEGDRPVGVRPRLEWHFDPPLAELEAGTSIEAEFRVASRTVDRPWSGLDSDNDAGSADGTANPCFALNPFVAGDAHVRKYDVRPFRGAGAGRESWSYRYTEHVSDYTPDVEDLFDQAFLSRSDGPRVDDRLTPEQVRYLSWRLILTSNAAVMPTVPVTARAFALSYRFE